MTALKIAAISAAVGAIATFIALALTGDRPKWKDYRHRAGRQ